MQPATPLTVLRLVALVTNHSPTQGIFRHEGAGELRGNKSLFLSHSVSLGSTSKTISCIYIIKCNHREAKQGLSSLDNVILWDFSTLKNIKHFLRMALLQALLVLIELTDLFYIFIKHKALWKQGHCGNKYALCLNSNVWLYWWQKRASFVPSSWARKSLWLAHYMTCLF